MKPIKKYANCEFCDTIIEVMSPPPKEQYESAKIEIINGMILLPDIVVDENDKGFAHAKNLDGIYCSPNCLINMLKKILGVHYEKYF